MLPRVLPQHAQHYACWIIVELFEKKKSDPWRSGMSVCRHSCLPMQFSVLCMHFYQYMYINMLITLAMCDGKVQPSCRAKELKSFIMLLMKSCIGNISYYIIKTISLNIITPCFFFAQNISAGQGTQDQHLPEELENTACGKDIMLVNIRDVQSTLDISLSSLIFGITFRSY